MSRTILNAPGLVEWVFFAMPLRRFISSYFWLRAAEQISYNSKDSESHRMMFELAYMSDGDVAFVIALVEDAVIANREYAGKIAKLIESYARCPVVLIGAQRHRTFGPPDLAESLRQTDYAALPWRMWRVAA